MNSKGLGLDDNCAYEFMGFGAAGDNFASEFIGFVAMAMNS